MRTTVYVAAGVNMLIAIVILIVDRLRDPEPVAAEAEAEARSQDAAGAAAQGSTYLDWVLLGSFALSGFASLVYENAWTRSLTLVIGSSIYSFTTMLVTFLIGLALGGFIYARVLGNREARLSTFGLIELWVGLSALATIPLFERLPLIFVRLLHGFGDTFTVFLYLQIFLSALVMFIPTILLGHDVSPGGAPIYPKPVSRRQRRRQLLRGQYRRRGARRLCRRLYFDPQYRRAEHDHLRRRDESC